MCVVFQLKMRSEIESDAHAKLEIKIYASKLHAAYAKRRDFSAWNKNICVSCENIDDDDR